MSEEINSQGNLLSQKDQFSLKETSPREPDNLPLQKNKLLNKNHNYLSEGNEEPFQTLNHFPNPPTYKNGGIIHIYSRLLRENLVSKKRYLASC